MSWIHVPAPLFVVITGSVRHGFRPGERIGVRDIKPGFYEREALEDLVGQEKVQSLIDAEIVSVAGR